MQRFRKVNSSFTKKFNLTWNDTIVNLFVNFIAIFANRLQDIRTHLVEGRKWFREGWQRICSGSSKGLLVYWCRGIYSYLWSIEEQVRMYGAFTVLAAPTKSSCEFFFPRTQSFDIRSLKHTTFSSHWQQPEVCCFPIYLTFTLPHLFC